MKGRWARLALDIGPLQQYPAFRSLYIARSVSLLSVAILAVTVSWQVYGISGSSVHVAGVGVGLALGSLVGLLWGGTLADRADRRRVMICGRGAYVVVVALLWANSLRSTPGLAEIYVITLLSGLTSGISAPALMAAMPRLVPPQQLASAGALNAIAMELSRLVGPLIAGLILARLGLAACYALVLAGAAAVPLLLSRLPKDILQPEAAAAPASTGPGAMLAQWIDGFRHARHNGVIAGLLALDLATMLFASVHALLPQLGQAVLQGGPEMVGVLYAAPAFGALLVAAASGWTRDLTRPGCVVIACAALWGLSIALAGVATGGVGGGVPWGAWAVVALLTIAGMADTASDIVRGALLQIHTPDSLRGRISGLWLLQGYVAPALGGLQSGALAGLWSPGRALLAGGSACTALVIVLMARPHGSLRRELWSAGFERQDTGD